MVPVFLAHQEPLSRMLAIINFKVVVGVIVGIVVDVILRALHRAGDGHPHIRELCERAHCHCDDLDEPSSQPVQHASHDHEHTHGHSHAHTHDHAHGHWWHIVRSALIHTVEVTVSIFVITTIFGLVIELVGEQSLAVALGTHPIRAVLLAALVGLVPNCGASVAITELYLSGALAAGPMAAGLLVSGGVGLLVLFRTNADQRQNVEIAAFIYVVGVLAGLLVSAFGIIF